MIIRIEYKEKKSDKWEIYKDYDLKYSLVPFNDDILRLIGNKYILRIKEVEK